MYYNVKYYYQNLRCLFLDFFVFCNFSFFLFVNYPSDPNWNLAEQYSPLSLSWAFGPILLSDFLLSNTTFKDSCITLISYFDYFIFPSKLVKKSLLLIYLLGMKMNIRVCKEFIFKNI